MLGRIVMSLVGGTGVGAALMYAFDPELGGKHRKAARRMAKEKSWDWRGKLADRLMEASGWVAPENGERMELTPGQARAAVVLSKRAREHNVARETYSRARDVYYRGLIDLDLARARGRRRGDRSRDFLAAAGCCAAGAAGMYFLRGKKSTG